MTRELLIFFSFLVVFSYILEVISKKIRVPTVIFLIASGILIGWIGRSFSIKIPDITPYLMLIGGVSLVLVVLQGAMELKWAPQKNRMIIKMLLMCILPMFTLSFMIAGFFTLKNHTPFTQTLYNVIPIAIISSAIAIPAAQLLNHKVKEQIVYESSFSDILGILFFDFVFRNHGDLWKDSGLFIIELGGTFILTILATILIAWLLGFIPSGIRFIPILGVLVFIFEVAEYFQLPALIFIFIFGLFIGNLERFMHLPFLHHIKPKRILNHTGEFYRIVSELGFLARSFFFLTLGLYVKPSLFTDYHSLIWSSGILSLAFLLRFIYLKLLRIHVKPNILFAPRGLVTILLFLYIPASKHIEAINFNIVIMIVLLSTLILAIIGLLEDEKENENRVSANKLPE